MRAIITSLSLIALVLSASCGDETQVQNQESQLSLVARASLSQLSASERRLLAKAKNPIRSKQFDRNRYEKGETIGHQDSGPASLRLRRDIKCSDDGRLCLDCYYKPSGELLYCDVYHLPARQLQRF